MIKKPDWGNYNERLVERGSFTLWINEEALSQWGGKKRAKGRGRQEEYSDQAIECALTLKAIYKLTYRSTEGFIRSLVEVMQLKIKVPDYSLLCKRQVKLKIKLARNIKEKEPLHLVVDTTGLKIYGEGEWLVRQHGKEKRRVWRKLHLGVNKITQEIECFELTDLKVQDFEGLLKMTKDSPYNIKEVIADGSYDRYKCYEDAESKGYKLITPPQRNARTSQERPINKKKASKAAVKKRDQVIEKARSLGRKGWKIAEGYHQRSLSETAMFRVKTLLGNKLSSRKFEKQKQEVAIWCNIINKMNALSNPMAIAK